MPAVVAVACVGGPSNTNAAGKSDIYGVRIKEFSTGRPTGPLKTDTASGWVTVLRLCTMCVVFAPVLFLLLIHRAKLTAKKALLITVKVLLTIVLGGLGFFLALLIWMGGVAGGTAVLAGGAILPGKLVVGLIPVVAALIVLLLLWSGKSYL